ncbi:MAG: filamentous hemagglutinin N-terminal domain-containing protein, partial [Alphaproteobacteria bacterium]|nr:filamentous hemagglutinin N-terminal domain-containing protein [Alphaproteobacteria bacterium]
AGETASFELPTSGGATLNRIVGGASSTIAGTIRSNGTVFFVNPNGMLFNGTTQQSINAASFIVYTGVVNTNDFMRQQPLNLETPTASTTPTISISTPITVTSGGFVGVYGPQVAVTGKIVTNGGTVAIVSYNRNLTVGAVTSQGGEVRLTSGGNITLSGTLDLASGVIRLTSTASATRTVTSGGDGIGTITNSSDIIADRLSITSSGQGSVTLNNVHIARLGDVTLSTPQGDKLFSLTNRRELTVDGAISLYGALALKTVDSPSYGITISSAITVNQIQSAANNPINTSANLVSLNINSAGSLTTSGDVFVSGDATVTASDDVSIGANLVAMQQFGTGDPTRGNLTLASTNGGLVTTGTTVGLKSLTVSAATGIELGRLGSKGDIRVTKSCSVIGCTQIAGDITLNGSVFDYDYPDAVVSAKVQNLSISNSYGNTVLNHLIEVDKNITIEAINGSVTQNESQYGIVSRNGKINLRSTSSNDAVGILVRNLAAQTLFTDARGTTVVTAMRDAIVLESDSDIVVETSYSTTATGRAATLQSDFGSIKLTSTNGSISVLG